MNLNDYFVRHGQKSELARAIGVPAILVSQWSLGQRPVPIARCKAIESATDGAVTCKDLRPDDWHEIWPELADLEEKQHLPQRRQVVGRYQQCSNAGRLTHARHPFHPPPRQGRVCLPIHDGTACGSLLPAGRV
jgi:DNA-binding transcriptional regulator YdaS (Cro superfamily)